MATLILLNKPFNVLSQFTDKEQRPTLQDYVPIKNVYPAGRLDYDSEGLLLLTNDGQLQSKIANPRHKMEKTYWAQVEGIPTQQALEALRQGVVLKDGPTRPAKIEFLCDGDQLPSRSSGPERLWPRTPPIRQRANDTTSWLQLSITEGRNRQVRRMTAHVGHPTLRLIRVSIGDWHLGDLRPGEFKSLTLNLPVSRTSELASKAKRRPSRRASTHQSKLNRKTNGTDKQRSKPATSRKGR